MLASYRMRIDMMYHLLDSFCLSKCAFVPVPCLCLRHKDIYKKLRKIDILRAFWGNKKACKLIAFEGNYILMTKD